MMDSSAFSSFTSAMMDFDDVFIFVFCFVLMESYTVLIFLFHVSDE